MEAGGNEFRVLLKKEYSRIKLEQVFRKFCDKNVAKAYFRD